MAKWLSMSVLLQLLRHVLSAAPPVRQAISLDGEWKFVLQQPSYADFPDFSNMSGVIQVPGSWEAQGYGKETVQMRWQVLTGDNAKGRKGAIGTYSKTVTVPECGSSGKSIFMVDQGIHRHATFTIVGKLVGEHTGYMTPFEADISSLVDKLANNSVDIVVTLDGDRPCDTSGCSDALMGTEDDDSDGTNLGGWAGLNGHISIECRPPSFIDGGVGNIIPPYVTHPPVTVASAGKPLQVSVAFVVGGTTAQDALVRIFDSSTGALIATAKSSSAVLGNTTLQVTIPDIKLWSPANRSLYSVEVSIGHEDTPLDSVKTRFGVRTVAVVGYKFFLNGQRLFLAGYGDDAIYPATVSPPREKATYANRLKMAHELGFNFVRHHSHVLPPEYFEAADEWGIMISPELACIYGKYFRTANATAMELYHKSWASYIARLRNHPSIFDWPLCNEMYMGAAKAQVFYDIKQQLDPNRLMIDQDGACSPGDKRDSNDFCSHQFDIGSLGAWGSIPLDEPSKYHDTCNRTTHVCSFSTAPLLPIISHETGNYNTYPRIKSLMEKFSSSGTTIKPYWLSGALEKLNASGLLQESEEWSTASEQLYVLCWKIDVEDQRRNSEISGYEWWLLQDYWTGNNGIVDTFFRPKPGVAAYIGQFNAESIFLQDGLKLSYTSKETLNIDISLSNYGSDDLPTSAKVQWAVLMDGQIIKTATVPVSQSVSQGDLGVVATVSIVLPDVGTTISVPFGATDGAKTITISAEFDSPALFAASVPRNTWNATVFPTWVDSATPANWTVSVVSPNPHGGDLLQGCGFSNCKTAPAGSVSATCSFTANMDFPNEKSGGDIPVRSPSDCCELCRLDLACKVAVFENSSSSGICHIKTTFNGSGIPRPGWIAATWGGGTPFPRSVYLTTYIDDSLMQAAQNGSVVLLLQNSTDASPLQTTPTRFKQAWWLGTPEDNNAGTMVYKDTATQKIFGGMAPDGYADQSWFRMVNGAQTFLLDNDKLPPDWVWSPPTVMMRAIDIVGFSRSKALVFHKSVGKGHIVATGLNCFQPCAAGSGCEYAEKAWVLDRLLRYSGSLLASPGDDWLQLEQTVSIATNIVI